MKVDDMKEAEGAGFPRPLSIVRITYDEASTFWKAASRKTVIASRSSQRNAVRLRLK